MRMALPNGSRIPKPIPYGFSEGSSVMSTRSLIGVVVTSETSNVGYMARGHPVDSRGRVLPDPAWPADKAAPDSCDLVRRFCNTSNRESGADRFETAADLTRWFEGEGVLSTRPDPEDLDRVVEFREHTRAHARAHHDRTETADLDAVLADHLADLELRVVMRDGRLEAVPAPVSATNEMIGAVVVAIMDAQRNGCWPRFKACPSCHWVFYDRSKNQAGRWCSMSACGGRAKVAAFRERQKESIR